MRDFISVVNAGTAISTTTIGGVVYVNANGTKFQIKQGQSTAPAVQATVPGVAGTAIVTFGGTYVAGDQVKITMSLPGSTQRVIKNYSYTVPTGGTVTSIAAYFASAITTDIAAGTDALATAANVAGVLTITQSSVMKEVIGESAVNGVVTAYTDSAAGTAVVTDTATTIEQGTPAVLLANGVDAADITLATYSTVNLVAGVDAAIPFIDSDGKTVKEIKFYSTPTICTALLAAL